MFPFSLTRVELGIPGSLRVSVLPRTLHHTSRFPGCHRCNRGMHVSNYSLTLRSTQLLWMFRCINDVCVSPYFQEHCIVHHNYKDVMGVKGVCMSLDIHQLCTIHRCHKDVTLCQRCLCVSTLSRHTALHITFTTMQPVSHMFACL